MMACVIYYFYPCKCGIFSYIFPSFCDQGNVPIAYIMSILDIYEAVLQESSNSTDHVTGKVKQEILHGLGTKSILHFNSFFLN